MSDSITFRYGFYCLRDDDVSFFSLFFFFFCRHRFSDFCAFFSATNVGVFVERVFCASAVAYFIRCCNYTYAKYNELKKNEWPNRIFIFLLLFLRTQTITLSLKRWNKNEECDAKTINIIQLLAHPRIYWEKKSCSFNSVCWLLFLMHTKIE